MHDLSGKSGALVFYSDLVLQAHSEGSSLRGISRTSGLAYNTVVSIIRSASQKAQLVHNEEVQSVEAEEVCADEMWSFVA